MSQVPGSSSAPVKPMAVDPLKKGPSAPKPKLTLHSVKAKPKSRDWSLNSLYKRIWYNYYKGDKDKLTLHTCWILEYTEIPLYFFTILDVCKFKALFKYRIHYRHDEIEHLGIRNYPPLDLIIKATKVSQFNFLFAYMIPSYILIKLGSLLGIYVYDTEEDDKEVTWWRLIKEVTLISILADFGFYFLHRFVHRPEYYIGWHKKHHDFKYTIGMAHHWMTFHESLLFYLPQVLPPLILWPIMGRRLHVTSLWAGMFFTQINGTLGHAGYRMPVPKWLPFFQPAYHDFHHVDYKVNFGAIFPFVDQLFGTYYSAGLEKDMAKVLTERVVPGNGFTGKK